MVRTIELAITLTTGLQPTIRNKNDTMRYLIKLIERLKLKGIRFQLFMEEYNTEYLPTKLHFHGIIKYETKLQGQHVGKFLAKWRRLVGFTDNKKCKNRLAWNIYSRKQYECGSLYMLNNLNLNDLKIRFREKVKNKIMECFYGCCDK